MYTQDPFDNVTARMSRRATIGGLIGGLGALATRDLSALAGKKKKKEKMHSDKKGYSRAGKQAQTEIVGGTIVPQGEIPFVVAVLNIKYGKNSYDQQFCGGSLIGPYHVLTAAHCVKPIAAKNLGVTVGRWNLQNPTQGEVLLVTKVTVHPGYNAKSGINDAAILELASSAKVGFYPPIRLADSGDLDLEAPGASLFSAGWGDTSPHILGKGRKARPNYPPEMYQVGLPAVGTGACREMYDKKKGSTNVDLELMICAGKAGVDSCFGDSGGPLFAVTPSGEYVLVGVVSKGTGCADGRFPGIYTRVSVLNDWIVSQTGGAFPLAA